MKGKWLLVAPSGLREMSEDRRTRRQIGPLLRFSLVLLGMGRKAQLAYRHHPELVPHTRAV